MDFNVLKKKAIKFKDDAISTGAKKLSESSLVIKTIKDLDSHISKSKNTSFTNKDTGKTKNFNKYCIVIFADKKSEFYKNALIQVPVLVTKAWSGGVSIKLSDLSLKKLEKYGISYSPSLALFSNQKLIKLITSEEDIKNIVKTLDLDIISSIKNIK